MSTRKKEKISNYTNFNQKKSNLFSFILKFGFLVFFSLSGWADTNNNDSCNDAQNIALNYSTTSGSMSKFDTRDYYNFSVPSAGTLTITTSNASRDLDGYLYNASCTTQYDKDDSYNDNPVISYDTTGAQNFTFLLYDYEEKSTNYNLVITFISSSPNNLPQITSNGGGNTASVNLDEGVLAVTTVIATDSDGDSITYSISGGDDQDDFSINSSSGILTFSSSTDFENPSDNNFNNIYNVIVMASDSSGGSDTQSLTITVNDVLEDIQPGENITCQNVGTNDERCSDINLNQSFDIRYGGRGFAIHGDFAVTGSSIMCVNDGGNCDWDYNGNLYDAQTTFLQDSGNSSFTLNSSSASLKLPDGVTADEIIYARLYWQGHVGKSGSSHNSQAEYLSDIAGWDNITLETPGGNTYNLTASSGDKNWYGWWGKYGNDGLRFMYQANVDVTNIIKSSYTNAATSYSVGNLIASEGYDAYTLALFNDGWYDSVKAGFWGGWSLIVVYERDHELHPDQKYKNIAIYDGFDVMFPWQGYTPLDIEIDIDGFLTPLKMPESGFIDSKMAFLGFGGEKNIPRDYFQMSNASKSSWYDLTNSANPDNGQFNGSITNNGIPLVSGRIYNSGMDLDIFDVSNHMQPNQSQTSLKLGATYEGSNADQILPSMVAFSTEIFSPRVCYMETLYYNGEEVGVDNIPSTGETITTSLIIRNDGDEIVDKAKFYTTFDANYTYNDNSTLIGNTQLNGTAENKFFVPDNTGLLSINKIGDDTNMSIYLGYNAKSSEGGILEIDAEAKVDFNGTFNNTNFIAKNYFISYENTNLGLSYDGKVFKCVDFDNSFAYTPPLGTFNVVNEFSAITTTDPVDSSNVLNSLLTQIAGKSFNVKVLSLDSDLTTLKSTENSVILDVVDGTNITNDQSTCDIAPILYSDDANMGVTFNNTKTEPHTNTISLSAKNAAYRVKYMDWANLFNIAGTTCANMSNMSANLKGVPQCLNSVNQIKNLFGANGLDVSICTDGQDRACDSNMYDANGVNGTIIPSKYNHEYGCVSCLLDIAASYTCSRDNFSIRPETYSMDMNETKLIGNRDYRLDINATQSGVDINALEYTQIINNTTDKNATTQLDVNTTSCTNPNVDTNVTVFTTNFAFVDGQAQLMNYRYPDIGDVNITINDSKWTQVDQSMYNEKSFSDCIENSSTNTPNLEGKIGCIVSGMRQFVFSPKEFRNRLILQDFDDGNFTYINNDRNMSARLLVNIKAILDNNETATNYTAGCFSKDINTTIRILPNPIDGWLTNDRTATQRIIFFDDQNITTTRENNNIGWMTLSSKEGNFTNGIADINVTFNFSRNTSIPDEPFHIKRDDFNITVIDTADTNGSDFNRTAQNYNATFYYGQVYVQEQRFVGNGAGQPFWINYEVYSTSNRIRRADFNLTGWESPDNVNWYNNTRHLNNTPGDFNTSVPVARAINDNAGMTFTKMSFQQLQLTHTAPHKDKIVLTPSPWLVFNRFDNAATTFDFLVEFLEGASTWAGEGRLGDTVDANVSTRQNRRIDW